MSESELFLGICLTPDCQESLNLIDDSLKSLFISTTSEDYLQKVEMNGLFYLGKFLRAPLPLSELESIEKHILSILNQLFTHLSNFPPLTLRCVLRA